MAAGLAANGVTEVTVPTYLTIDRDVAIQGPGATGLTIRHTGPSAANGNVFYIKAGNVTLSGLTVAGDSGGTPLYMAPEQVTNFRDVKPPADQYSAAATLYYLLTGHGVYDAGGDYVRVMLRVMEEEPVPLRSRRAEVPEALAAAVHRALARKPGDRFADVAGFSAALAPFSAIPFA